jgi:hypothetical protein
MPDMPPRDELDEMFARARKAQAEVDRIIADYRREKAEQEKTSSDDGRTIEGRGVPFALDLQ